MIPTLRTLNLQPGDRLVVQVNRPLSHDMVEHVRRHFTEALGPDLAQRIIVLDSGLDLAVLRTAREDLSERISESW